MMNKIILLFLIFNTSLYAQNHGTGGGNDTIENEDQNDLATEKCLALKDLERKLVTNFNGSSNQSIHSYKDYVEKVTSIAYKIKFNELKNASEQKIRVKCGDKYVNKILEQNKWLMNKELHTLFGKINNMDAGQNCFGYDYVEIAPYVKFLEIWTGQESPKMTPVERHIKDTMNDHILNTSG